jgi:MFS family permease
LSALFFLVPLCGIAILGFGAEGPLAILAAILLGIGIGAEVDIMAFLVSRYFGLLHYGAIYGTLHALFTFGSGMGPWLVALGFDHFHSYTVALIGAGIGLLVASALVSRLVRIATRDLPARRCSAQSYRGCIRIAPSRRIVSPLSIGFSTI